MSTGKKKLRKMFGIHCECMAEWFAHKSCGQRVGGSIPYRRMTISDYFCYTRRGCWPFMSIKMVQSWTKMLIMVRVIPGQSRVLLMSLKIGFALLPAAIQSTSPGPTRDFDKGWAPRYSGLKTLPQERDPWSSAIFNFFIYWM